MLEVTALRKSYGDIVAVDGVSLKAGKGETIGLLGPNGAGKTTTVSMIAGLVRPDSGTVFIGGRKLHGDTDPAKRAIGLVPQDIGLYPEISARENLHLFGALYGMDGARRKRAIDAALDLVGLAERAKDKVAGFSGGMTRRLNLAAAPAAGLPSKACGGATTGCPSVSLTSPAGSADVGVAGTGSLGAGDGVADSAAGTGKGETDSLVAGGDGAASAGTGAVCAAPSTVVSDVADGTDGIGLAADSTGAGLASCSPDGTAAGCSTGADSVGAG